MGQGEDVVNETADRGVVDNRNNIIKDLERQLSLFFAATSLDVFQMGYDLERATWNVRLPKGQDEEQIIGDSQVWYQDRTS